MNKRIFVVLMLAVMSLSCVYASDTINVQLNGEYIDFTDENGEIVNPEMINNRTMVPMRKIFEVVGAEIEWNGEEKIVVATTEAKVIQLQIDNNEAILKDKNTGEEKTIELDAAPVILNNRTMVPVRFIAESLDRHVGWDKDNRCVIIIDYSFIEEGLNEHASNLMEFLNMEKAQIDSIKSVTNISGTLNYKDGENKKYNEKVELNGKITLQKSKDNIVLADLEIKTTGNGEIQKSLENMGYNKITYSVISDGENTYTKSSSYDTRKWKKMDATTIVNQIKTEDGQSLIDSFKISDDELTIDSYNSIKTGLEMVYKLFGNDKLKATGTTNKKFELSLDIAEELRKLFGNTENQLVSFLSLSSLNLKTSVVYKGDKLNKVELELDFYIENAETEESTKANLEISSIVKSINNTISLKMPKTSEIEK